MSTTYDTSLIAHAANSNQDFFRVRQVADYNDTGVVSFTLPVDVAGVALGLSSDYGQVRCRKTDTVNTGYPDDDIYVTPGAGFTFGLPRGAVISTVSTPDSFNLAAGTGVVLDLTLAFNAAILDRLVTSKRQDVQTGLQSVTVPAISGKTHAWSYENRRGGMVSLRNNTGASVDYYIDGVIQLVSGTYVAKQISPTTSVTTLASGATDAIFLSGPGFKAIRVFAVGAGGAAAGWACGFQAFD